MTKQAALKEMSAAWTAFGAFRQKIVDAKVFDSSVTELLDRARDSMGSAVDAMRAQS